MHFAQSAATRPELIQRGRGDEKIKAFLCCMSMVALQDLDDAWLEIRAQSPDSNNPANEAAEALKDAWY